MVTGPANTDAQQLTDATEPASTGATAYRPHLDGLRAVAVYLVVLFHAGSDPFSAGYIGVDVFFVLSGFLVTRLLLADIDRSGSIQFSRFYSRRFRRLLPAAFVALIVTGVVYTAIASPLEVSQAVSSFKAAFLYSTNWFFIHEQTNYFGADISANPVLHFWSLAVEEQFYLVWPLALGGAVALTRRLDNEQRMRILRAGVVIGALASAIWALSLKSSNPNRAYYGTDARAYELLAGAFIALVPTLIDTVKRFRRSLQAATVLSLLAVLLSASSWGGYDAIERGIAATVATCVLIVAVEAADGGLVKRALSTRSMVYLGKISYGTYLWHWLVILVVLKAFAISTVATIGIATLVATALASLSFEMLERPVRVSGLLERHGRAVIAAGLALSVVSALVLIPKIVDPVHAEAPVLRNASSAVLTPVPADLDVRRARDIHRFPNCFRRPASACTVVKRSGLRILLMGDSHAWMLIPLLRGIAHLENLELSATVLASCPWQRDLFTLFLVNVCKKEKADWYSRVLPALKPDIIVVVNKGYGAPGYPALVDGPGGAHANDAAISEATRSSVAALRAVARDVVIVEPIPLPRDAFQPLACLQKTTALEHCRYTASSGPSPLELLYRDLAKHDHHVHALSLDRAVCPLLPTCDPVVNGQIVKWDPSHLTKSFALTLVPAVDVYLRRQGVIREP